MSHTPEPWSLFTTYAQPELRDANGKLIAAFQPEELNDARRIAACVNACAGIPTGILEGRPDFETAMVIAINGATQDIKNRLNEQIRRAVTAEEQNAELRAALERILASDGYYGRYDAGENMAAHDAASAALAKSKGGQQ